MDLVLRFGQKYSTGTFVYEMYMFVEEGKSAYFNFQRDQAIGTAWAMDAYFNPDGSMSLSTGAVEHYAGFYPTGQWFKIRFDINLDKNMWKFSLDDDCKIVFSNTTNALASINLYPTGTGGSIFFVDDVHYEYQAVSTPLLRDVGINKLTWDAGKTAGSESYVGYTIKNNGDETINDIRVTLSHDGVDYEYDFEGIEIFPGNTFDLESEQPITLVDGLNEITLHFSNIYGSTEDDEICNNSVTFAILAVTPAPNKAVLVEEGTGTWCVWCPRGAVYMDLLYDWYPGIFIPIAVHNNDPMMVAAYDLLIRSTPGFTGFPNVIINRQLVMDPAAMENPFLNEVSTETILIPTPGAAWDENTRKLDISGSIEFTGSTEGEYWASAVITEDNVRGSGTGWNQANAYAGGGNGVMGGYEALPNPVPANLMRYDHVARAILGITKSPLNTIDGTFNEGDRAILNYTMNVDPAINVNNAHVIIIVFGPTGYENARSVPFAEALENGFITSTHQVEIPETYVNVFPNPASSETFIELDLTADSPVQIRVLNMQGQPVAQRNYGNMMGEHVFPINTNSFANGMYIIEIQIGSQIQYRKLQVNGN